MTSARLVLFSLLILCFAAAPARAQDPVPTTTPASPPAEKRIKPGVFSGGVDLSNLTIPEAQARLRERLAAPLSAPVTVSVAGKRYRITTKAVGFAFDALRSAKRAYYAGENSPPDQSQGGGTAAHLDVPLAVTFRRGTIKAIVGRIDRRAYVAPRNATLRITLRRMIKRRAKSGRNLDDIALRKSIEGVLADPAASRLFKPGRKTVPAPINANDLARLNPTVLTVSKSQFRLRLFKNLRFVKSYGVATGLPAYPTPSGLFRIQNKAVNPTWTVPNSPWAGELRGQSVSGSDPSNPLKARWMGIANGIGIHGTGQEYSVGTRASHGCLRMRVAEVIDLYRRVPVGTPILIR